MKIKLSVNDDLYPVLLKKLTEAGFEINDDAELILSENIDEPILNAQKSVAFKTTEESIMVVK